jgi:anti-sigma regulatory factor (Ser/Thr protein kinase)
MPSQSLKKHDRGFLESYCASTTIVPEVIESLINDLRYSNYRQDEIDEIVLSMDEALTNAVQETIKKNCCNGDHADCDRRDITVRYNINDSEFDATVIDHGKGLDIFNILSQIPDMKAKDYADQVLSYATKSEKNKIKVRMNGKEIPLHGIGAGLKIIINFMDTVTIDLIDKKLVLTTLVSDYTDGTILNMKRKRRIK